jgi:hypothetical protein
MGLLAILGGCSRGPLPCPGATFSGDIAVPAVSTTRMVQASLDARTDFGWGSLTLSANQGTLSVAGKPPMQAFIWDKTQYSSPNQIVYSGLASADDAWYPFWLTCTPSGQITQISIEATNDTAGTMTNQLTSGPCIEARPYLDMPLDLPATTLKQVNLTCGFRVSDASASVPMDLEGSRPGAWRLEGLPATALVFASADCRSGGCGPGSPWYELHAVVWEPQSGQVGFTIFYLDGTTSGIGVSTNFGILFPSAAVDQEWSLADPAAAWTIAGR